MQPVSKQWHSEGYKIDVVINLYKNKQINPIKHFGDFESYNDSLLFKIPTAYCKT
jgi:hypothetical protein